MAPLVQGWVAEIFGLRWQAMISGITFFSHQLGSFAGAFGGGLLYDRFLNYDLAWQIGALMGIVVGGIQIAFAFIAEGRFPRLAT